MRRLLLALACGLALIVPAAAQAALPWSSTTLQLGLADDEGGAAALAASAPFGLRYHYLAGGVNTGQGWQTWARGGGTFVTDFVGDSAAHGAIPVFSYYQLRQSQPGAGQPDERAGDLANLRDRNTMLAWFEDLKAVFQAAGSTGQVAVVQVEPDLWGYAQQAGGDDAAAVPAQVAATGLPELRGLPNTVAGLAQGVVRLRNAYAPHVLVAYPLSIWGTGKDISVSDESPEAVDVLAARSARFQRSLHASFDAVFAEFADRDSGYAVARDRRGRDAWWDATDFARHARYLADVHAALRLPIVLWQIPLGNTLQRAMDDTPHHYQDNRVQWLLGGDARAHLGTYVRAGVVALLFGSGQPDATCACDAAHDGVTNPPPIDGNARPSLSADDDGGYFRARARAYYAAGPLRLPRRIPPPRHRRPAGPAHPRHPGRFSTRVHLDHPSVRRGGTATIRASVRPTRSQTALVSIEVYRGRRRVFQRYFDHAALRRRHVRTFRVRWAVPKIARAGAYVVKVGVFGPGFQGLRAWNDRAAVLRIRG